jgi:hypothetical protein
MKRDQWFLTIHHEARGEDSFISENEFSNFTDVHAAMKRNKGRAFIIKIPKTAKPIEIRAFHNLKNLGYLIDAR